MEQSPLVSVIIPFYNVARYLTETVESVLAQTYTHWEMYLVDDGSTDGSTEIAKAFARNHSDKVFYLEHPGHSNHGVCASRNLGVASSRGPLLAFLDADDIWLPQKLEQQVAIHKQYPQAGLITEGSVHWYNWEDPNRPNYLIPIGVPANHLYAPQELSVRLYPLGKGATPGPCAWMLTREAVERAGGFDTAFHGELQLYEDQVYLSKVFLNEYVYIADTCNNWYRQRSDSAMNSVKYVGRYNQVRKKYLEFMKKYLQEKGVNNKQINWLIWRANFRYKYPLLYNVGYRIPQEAWHTIQKLMPKPIRNIIEKKPRPV